jgi:predicted small metal-binding protein
LISRDLKGIILTIAAYVFPKGREEVKIMEKKLKSITCDPMCGFLVRSHDEEELIEMALAHGNKKHPEMKMTKDQIRSMIKPA